MHIHLVFQTSGRHFLSLNCHRYLPFESFLIPLGFFLPPSVSSERIRPLIDNYLGRVVSRSSSELVDVCSSYEITEYSKKT